MRARENGTGSRKSRNPRKTAERSPPMQTVKLAARYTRYLLTSLATVAFGLYAN
jgi:hypothetical protein